MKLSNEDRYNKIIQLLYEAKDYITVDEISKSLDISSRNAYYTIKDINTFLTNNKLDKINTIYGKGMKLDDNQKAFFKQYHEHVISFDMTSLSQLERVSTIYYALLFTENALKIKDFEEIFEVSRFTIINDINALKDELSLFDLELVYDNKLGYSIMGDEYAKRKAFFYFFSNIYNIYNDPGFIAKVNVNNNACKYYKKLKLIEKNGAGYFDCVLQGLASIIDYMYKNKTIPLHINNDIDNYWLDRELSFVEEEFKDLSLVDKQYIATILYCGSVNRKYIPISDGLVDNLVIKMNDIYYLLSGINVNDDKDFIDLLKNHLTISLLRFKYGVFIDNPLLNEIKSKYQIYFSIVKQAVRVIELEIKTPISDSEIGFLVLYYVGYNQKIKMDIPKVNALLVCVNGLSTSYLLINEIEHLDNRISVVGHCDINNYASYLNKDIDLIITNIDHNTFKDIDTKVININSFLTEEDKLLITNSVSKIIFEKSDNIINENVISMISNEFIDTNNKINNKKEHNVIYKEVFKPEFVEIVDNSLDWKKEILNACKCLVDNGYIDDEYGLQIIKNIEKYGNYMVFKNGYLIGHASIEHSNKLGLSFVKLKHEIDVKGRMVDKIMIFTPNNKIDHIPILNSIVLLLENDEIDKMINDADNKLEIYNIISKLIYIY